MKSSRRRVGMIMVATFAAAVVGALLVQRPGTADEAAPQRVLWSDLGTRVQIIGEIGKPLGQMATIRGRWVIPPGGEPDKDGRVEGRKDDSPEFVIDSVDGVRLDPPPRISRYRLGFLDSRETKPEPLTKDQSVVWELRVFETGSDNSENSAAYVEFQKAYGRQIVSPQLPFDNRGTRKFCCSLVYVTAHPVGKVPSK